MKRMITLMLASMLVCGMFLIPGSAAETEAVKSPEYSSTDSESVPTSPQTGYEVGIADVVVIALMCGAVAVVSTKKAYNQSHR